MYEMSITRENRTAVAILIDCSGSMAEKVEFCGKTCTKAEAVAEVNNVILDELLERARRHDGIRDYYDVAVVGYSGDGVESMLGDNSNPFISIQELADRTVSRIKFEEIVAKKGDTKGLFVHREWVKPKATGQTPMHEALCYIHEYLNKWRQDPRHKDSFPPHLFHITDGEPTDCSDEDIIEVSRRIKGLTTTDGAFFLINVHITTSANQRPLIFPTAEEMKEYSGSRYAQLLAESASEMPEMFNESIREIKGVTSGSNFRGMSFNASIAGLITILNIGSISVKFG